MLAVDGGDERLQRVGVVNLFLLLNTFLQFVCNQHQQRPPMIAAGPDPVAELCRRTTT